MPGSSKDMSWERIGFSDITGWDIDDHVAAFDTFLKSCGDFSNLSDTQAIGKGPMLAPALVWKELCRKADLLPTGDERSARKFFEEQFVAMKISSHSSNALVTGYYEPLLNGSRTQKRPYVYPVYKLPVHPISYTRQQIDMGYIKDKAGVIAYVDDPVQLFFLHVQGSGTIKTDDGEIIHVGFAGDNNQSYVAIGKVMVEKGLIDKKDASMQTIRQWLYDNANQMWQILWENPRYIFFQEMNGGPFGSERVELTPYRSLAVDKNFIPLGMPLFIDTVLPGTTQVPFTINRKLMIAQDTGRAIIGPLRGDIFFGSGPAAEQLAGHMKAGGEFTLLVPHDIVNKMLREQ